MTIKRLFLFLSFFVAPFTNEAQSDYPLKEGDPTQHGFDRQALDSLTSFLEESGISSLVILHDGRLVYEFGNTDHGHTIHSMRKPLMNALYGIYVGNGTIDTTLTMADLGIDDLEPALTDTEKTATIADLLRSRSGVYHHAAAVSEGMLADMPERGSHKPDEFYYYNNWDFNTLGYILEMKTGEKIYDLFNKHIAQPLGMEYSNKYIEVIDPDSTYQVPDVDGYYVYETDKSKYPAYHFRLSARDLALFGQLYLNDGAWNGQQIIPKNWIDVSTRPYSVINPDYGLAYGMLWNVLMKTEERPSRSFYHHGLGVHLLAVYPAAKMVLVHRVDTENDVEFNVGDLYKIIGLVWGARGQ